MATWVLESRDSETLCRVKLLLQGVTRNANIDFFFFTIINKWF